MDKIGKLAGLVAVATIFAWSQTLASGGDTELEASHIDPNNIESLQRGARNFINYCSGCHSAQYVRFNTLGKGLKLSEDQLVDNLMFNAEKTFEVIRAAMPAEDAQRWFGKAPPDMSLMARSKGPDYIYNFLKGFYISPDSPAGVDNIALEGTSMPHVLWELQGYQEAIFSDHTETLENGATITTQEFDRFSLVTTGSMSPEEYEGFVRDTVNFLAYISEPVRAERRKLGVWVLMYLLVFLVLATMLKKQIWKDVK